MSGPSHPPTNEIEAIPENLFREPIDYLFADHFRQRVVCKFIDEIVFDPGAPGTARLAEIALDYMLRDLPLHIADEEQDLFPLLRARCQPVDNCESALSLLSDEHEKDEELSGALMAGLRALVKDRPPKDEAAFLKTASIFAESQRRHLAWEESLILPLARKRLSADDLAKMGRSMAKRRGASFPEPEREVASGAD